MNDLELRVPRKGIQKIVVTFLSCVICVSLNVIGSRIAALIGVNLYLDCIGTILAAMYGGVVPGIVCGYFSNLVVGLADNVSLYYGCVSVLIGGCAGYFATRGYFKSVPKTLVAILVFALIGGGLSSVIDRKSVV